VVTFFKSVGTAAQDAATAAAVLDRAEKQSLGRMVSF
jgi:ornithine cyclodeaminase/alanine dehydrogenase-like protein (mu-crystallin family)